MTRYLLLLVLLLCSSVQAAEEPIAWSELSFGPLTGSIASLSFMMAIDAVDAPGSAYDMALDEGDHWRCAVLLLDFLAAVERSANEEDLLRDPDAFVQEFARRHEGRTWEFWSGFARHCDAALAIGHPELLGEESQRLRIEMERAIAPLLSYRREPPAGRRPSQR